MASGESSLIFDTFQGRVQPIAFENGQVYLTAGSAIVSVRTDDCAVTPIIDRPGAANIMALTVTMATFSGLKTTRVSTGRGCS